MQAVAYSKSAPDFSTISIQQVPKPEPGEGQVLVKVAVAGVNPADSIVCVLFYCLLAPLDLLLFVCLIFHLPQ